MFTTTRPDGLSRAGTKTDWRNLINTLSSVQCSAVNSWEKMPKTQSSFYGSPWNSGVVQQRRQCLWRETKKPPLERESVLEEMKVWKQTELTMFSAHSWYHRSQQLCQSWRISPNTLKSGLFFIANSGDRAGKNNQSDNSWWSLWPSSSLFGAKQSHRQPGIQNPHTSCPASSQDSIFHTGLCFPWIKVDLCLQNSWNGL